MSAWTYREAIHLLNRASFGGTPEEIAACVRLGRQESVRRLVAGISLTDQPEALDDFNDMWVIYLKRRPTGSRITDHSQYWIYRMAYSQAPLVEKMTLFWHGHFATAQYKVNHVPKMLNQNTLLRQYALGNFRELVHKIGLDPAMLKWLDLLNSNKSAPNENYARELMELFTLGIGNYSEQDVKELARALTGWDDNGVTAFFKQSFFDSGTKTVLGVTGKLGYTEAVNVVLGHPAFPKFLAKKLLRYFAVDKPDQLWIDQVANNIKTMNTIGEVLQNLFNSTEFYNPKYRMAVIKAPADYVAGTLRALKSRVEANNSSYVVGGMGQELYSPPDVAGWAGGEDWMSGLYGRYRFAGTIAWTFEGINTSEFKPAQPANPDAWIDMWCTRFGIAELSVSTRAGLRSYVNDIIINSSQPLEGMKGLLQLVLMSPEAQMK
ncbi:hypothetical protein GCM10008018_14040 [Paenibacillus marchantiophytorum]|uniref:DUF1800 domain-containing protein n=1 Tax=Paenibacillus marchantiophytorum TaxID=1619310 RepID=A0ABQ2BRG5_9BACL|nr:DUF1800 domain-containing protein [Paenibacillus marchantiophytorum]GGI45821.1 hypothetical protein GCM10008018_14040 [Paenibacillus marchantiophytorum]